MGSPARVFGEDLPLRHRSAFLDRSDWVPKRDRSRLGSQYRLGAGKTGPIRVNAVLRTKACETKPICRGRPAIAEGRQGRPYPYSWAEARQTKPIPTSARAGADGRGRRWSGRWDRPYKRTQFGHTDKDRRGPAKTPTEPSLGPIAPNKPNLPRAGRKETPAAKTTSPAVAGDKRAKRSQFPVGGHRWTILDGSEYRLRAGKTSPIRVNAVLRTEACETNPIAPERYEGQVLYGK